MISSKGRVLSAIFIVLVAALLTSTAPALAAPSFEIGLERDQAAVSHSDERINYTINVKNLNATAASSAAAGDLIFCAGENPIRSWFPVGVENSIQWLRGGALIPGESANTHTVTAADAGKPLQCLVKGENAAGAAVEASLPAAVISPAPATPAPGPVALTPVSQANASRPTVTPTSGPVATPRTCKPPTNWNTTATATTASGSATLSAVTTAAGTGNLAGPATGSGDLVSGSTTLANVTTAKGSGTLTAGQRKITGLSTSSGAFRVGQTIVAEGLPAATTITGVKASELELSLEATASGAKALTAGSQPFQVGQPLEGPGIAPGTTIAAISGRTVTLSAPATATQAEATITGLVSKTVSAVLPTGGTFRVGQTIEGTGIPAGTTITAVNANTLELSALPTAPGEKVVLTAGSQPFAPGEAIVGAGIPNGTTITAVSGRTITLSNPATASASGVVISSAASGTWAYQWLRNSQPIAGAQSSSYQPTAADDSTVLQCQVIATNLAGSVLAASNMTTVGTVSNPPFNIPAGTPATIADPTTVRLQLPGGLGTSAYKIFRPGLESGAPEGWSCTKAAATPSTPAEVVCVSIVSEGGKPVSPGSFYSSIGVGAALGADAPDLAVAKATVSGSAAAESSTAIDEFAFDPFKAFGLTSLEAKIAADVTETVDSTQAGGHPVTASAGFTLERKRLLAKFPASTFESEKYMPIEQLRSVLVDTPRGFVGNALAVPELCPSAEAVVTKTCPPGSIVGGIQLVLPGLGELAGFRVRDSGPAAFYIYAIEPEFGKPAQFAFAEPLKNIFTFAPVLRADDGYAISIEAAPSPEVSVLEARPTLCGYGVKEITGIGNVLVQGTVICKAPGEPGANPIPLTTNPTRCSGPPPVTGISVDSWLHPGDFKHYETTSPSLEHCEQIDFQPSAELTPTSSRADTPTGMNVEIAMPTEGLEGKNPDGSPNPNALAQANLDTATITFPKGMAVNPAASDGLGACSLAQIKLHSNDPDQCPASAKVGTVEVDTPLIQETLTGNVYVAKQNDNPFKSTLGLYMVFSSARDGITIKIAGKLVPDPVTGQLTSIFTENPEQPFSRLSLRFNAGPRAPLINPPKCGTYAIHSEFSPWSAANPANPTAAETVSGDSTFAVTQGPGGGPCPSGALDPKLAAGLENPTAAAKSPFVLRLSREDGSDRFTALDVTMPKGLTAYLKGVPYCPDSVLAAISGAEETGAAELAHPACPAASQVGTVSAAAGAGAFPFQAPGKAYLAGPYKGAPISIAIVTPALAGPFDLGTVVVRNALHIDPETAQVTVSSDPIPTILHGLLLDVREVRVAIDRPQFTAAPTNCQESAIDAKVKGTTGNIANVAYPFRAGGCTNLPFKPRLSLRLFGGTRRGAHPRLQATLTARPGDANIAAASVALPHSEFLAQSHIRTICTRVQFAAHACPAGAIYGTATATTPLLDQPLSGPVYLRSSSNPLPDLVVALRGPDRQPIEVVLAGRVDSVHGGIRNSFELIPDQPVSSFSLKMQGGSKGLLENSRDICKSKNRATVRFVGQNGRTASSRPLLQSSCAKAGGKKGKQPKGKKRP